MAKKTDRVYLFLILIFFSLITSCNQENTGDVKELSQDSKNLITPDIALKISSNILFHQNATTSKNTTTAAKKVKSIKPVKYNNEENLFYIINYEDGGFVILSADNRLAPILAYSDTSVFRTDANDYSSGLVGWLGATSDTIKSLRKSNMVQSLSVRKEWDSYYSKRLVEPENMPKTMSLPDDSNNCVDEYEQVGPLTTTQWDQGCGYNDLMPPINCSVNQTCGKAWAGCVPIAIAQIMKYHKFPTTYNWANMPPSGGSTTIASLIKDIHNSIGSSISYSCDGTSVSSDYNVAVIFTRFNYSYASYGNYSSETVKQQLRSKKPVILSGGPKENFLFFTYRGDGHMWVCDGFRRTKICSFNDDGTVYSAVGYLYLSMNWGWNGYENGWYAFNNFNPYGRNYNFKVKMAYNITP